MLPVMSKSSHQNNHLRHSYLSLENQKRQYLNKEREVEEIARQKGVTIFMVEIGLETEISYGENHQNQAKNVARNNGAVATGSFKSEMVTIYIVSEEGALYKESRVDTILSEGPNNLNVGQEQVNVM